MEKLTEKDLLEIGFKPIPHFTIQNGYTFDLGRRRYLTIGDFGKPNEMLLICEKGYDGSDVPNDIVVLHNYDFDGYMTREKLQMLINSIGTKEKNHEPHSPM